ncbi:hypothetical protein CGLO_08888 [Colletotrichum gloeosporioides Cg-14]|uniref:Uncharacterized protein n=1 Tax=Colletotrichum gloeosporioides (strain Cg-14) TaxID=1237896 RepID=T0KHD8_COLGC|nr:hypothetical protein CGLO_08888 [Colletotrichum gloeosporioides Cg-14]
MKRREINDL